MTKVPFNLKSDFRETARRIVAKDRTARRYGWSQNTIGAIKSALERAYKLGYEHALLPDLTGAEDTSAIRWEDIPPSSRDILSSIAHWMTLRLAADHRGAILLKKVPSSFVTARWALLSEAANPKAPRFAKRGIGPLLKMDILVALDEGHEELQVTEVGAGIIQDYLRRSNQSDPTLPKFSLRG